MDPFHREIIFQSDGGSAQFIFSAIRTNVTPQDDRDDKCGEAQKGRIKLSAKASREKCGRPRVPAK